MRRTLLLGSTALLLGLTTGMGGAHAQQAPETEARAANAAFYAALSACPTYLLRRALCSTWRAGGASPCRPSDREGVRFGHVG
jgi:hypothetical protein